MQSALNDSLLQSLTNIDRLQVGKLYRLLQAQDFAGIQTLLHAFYASIANDWYRKNELTNYEGYYASVFTCATWPRWAWRFAWKTRPTWAAST